MPGFTEDTQYFEYMKIAVVQTSVQRQCTYAFLKLYHAFHEAGIQPLVMKGLVCRQLYGALCDHRPSGDEDILIRKQDFEAVQRVLLSEGFRSKNMGVTERQLDQIQEIPFHEPDSGLVIEVHINPFGTENDQRVQLNQYFCSVFSRAQKMQVEDTAVWTLSHTDHFLFLVLHAFKHLYGGFGIRLMLDILLYLEQFGKEIDWEYAKVVLQETGTHVFLSDLIVIGNRYFGFRLKILEKPSCPEDLLEDMVSCGVFGNETQSQRTASHMQLLVDSDHRIKTALAFIFPGKRYFVAIHPELVERPWLLPVCWVERWLRFLRHNQAAGGRLIQESGKIRRRRMKLLKKYGIL